MALASLGFPEASGKKSRFLMWEHNLGLMQEVIRKDPESYKEEFMQQLDFFEQSMKLLHLQPSQHRLELQLLLDCINFLSGIAQFFKAEAKIFADNLLTVLREAGPGLDAEVRMQFCKALVCLRNKNLIDHLVISELFIDLMKIEDKRLRRFVIASLSAHIQRLGTQKRDTNALNKMHNFCISKLKDSRSVIVRTAQLVLIDAFRRQTWRDTKTANAIAECCFHKIPKIQVAAMKFFLGSKEDEEGIEVSSDAENEEIEKEAEQKTLKDVMLAYRNAKKTKKRTKDFERAKKMLSKKRKSKKDGRSKECNLLAIQLLYDPQEFADRLFGTLQQKKIEKFEIRLFRIALIARLLGVHKLQTLGFYSYLHRYLQPKQKEVTRILLYAAQACHELVPPDTIEQIIHCIAQNFISDRNSPEAMTVGINAVREILTNCPFAATQELMQDLAEYKQYKNKNVSMAARGLIALCRVVNPKLLKKADRGRIIDNQDTEENDFIAFGVPTVRSFVPGAECLENEDDDDEEMKTTADNKEEDDDDDDWEEVISESEQEQDDEDEPVAKRCRNSNEAEDDEENEDEDEEMEDEESENDDDEGEIGDEDEDEDDDEEVTLASSAARAELPKQEEKIDLIDVARKKAAEISSERVLTQAEFKKIRSWQIKKQILGAKKLARGGKKREHLTNDDRRIEEEMFESLQKRDTADGLPRLNTIEHFHKKKKETKAERLERVRDGREGREEFGKPKKKGSHVGRTNAELAKKKVFQMVRAKKRGEKRQRSFRDQQKSLRTYLLKQAGRKPGNM